jgi:thiol:disulfide interchange protein DsbD
MFISSTLLHPITPTLNWITPHKKAHVSFTVPVDPDDALYREYISFSCDQEPINICEWTTNIDAVPIYDSVRKENKRGYTQHVTFDLSLDLQQPVDEATIRFTYYKKNKGSLKEKYIHVAFRSPDIAQEKPLLAITADAHNASVEYAEHVAQETEQSSSSSISCHISDLIKHTTSWPLQALLIFLLGALLSLTPCIYPMIPITVGIIQGQGSTSFIRNFAVSLCYTLGVACTFASLGIAAAYTGQLFGSFMQHPIVVLSIVAMLVYLALSMFGLYEMYIPKGMQSNNRFLKGGSPITAFLFGAVSGTVASPCVSPGLALVLSIVTGLGNPLLGFIFMFAFGVGLSLPLLIIGTFSGSLNVLPKAGMWMVEVKKLFGFLMLGMAINFAAMILPAFVSAWLWVALCAVAGIYYLKHTNQSSLFGRLSYNVLGIGLSSAAVLLSYFAIQNSLHPADCSAFGLWTDDYTCAHNQALHEHKMLLLKVEAPCCSMCTAIDKKFFQKSLITNILEQSYVPVHIDGSRTDNEVISNLVKKFSIIGFPTIIIIDPNSDAAVQTWASELYDLSVEAFGEILLKRAQPSDQSAAAL